MPTYNQCAFIRRAINSLFNQTYTFWELIIINDGCTDETENLIKDFLKDKRVKYIKNKDNTGLGHSLNQGLKIAKYDYIAYLPSDDFYYDNHLMDIRNEFVSDPNVSLVYSGIKYDNSDSLHSAYDSESKGVRLGFSMQLVQTVHKKTNEYWVERDEWISDDLFSMYWQRLLKYGRFVRTEKITAYWTSHPYQRHILISENYGGGINKARRYYKIKKPIRIRVAKEKFTDEYKLYSAYRKVQGVNENPLKILLVGELAYNPERIYALEEAGHKLYGLWLPKPELSFFTVGKLPFGHVTDLSVENWKDEIKQIKPDVIYAMLNWGAISFAYDVMRAFPDIPFAWHFKEGPHLAISMGLWDKLCYLYNHASLKIYINNTAKTWYEQFIFDKGLSFVMDGDLPKKECFKDCFSEKISKLDNETHTVVSGRMIGINEQILKKFSENSIHVHLYLENFHLSQAKLFDYYKKKYNKYFHMHPHCPPENWTKEFSKYDAGWLHFIESNNNGFISRATWDDLNIPAKTNTYAAAGIPLLHPDNGNNIVAIENVIREKGVGILFKNEDDLIAKLKDRKLLQQIECKMKNERFHFCFDYYVPELISMFRKIINKKNNG